MQHLQADNGSESGYQFEGANMESGIVRRFLQVKTLKYKAEVERFTDTLKYQCVYTPNLSSG
jgi:hypothetical protein